MICKIIFISLQHAPYEQPSKYRQMVVRLCVVTRPSTPDFDHELNKGPQQYQ